MKPCRRNLTAVWLATTTGLLAIIQTGWPSKTLAAVGLAGAILLLLALRDKPRARTNAKKTGSNPTNADARWTTLAPENPKPQKRDLEEY